LRTIQETNSFATIQGAVVSP